MTVLLVLESVVLALLIALVIGLLRTHAEVLRRLHELGAGIYETDTAPVAEHYRSKPGTRVVEIDGARPQKAVEADLLAAIEARTVDATT